ncbi:MAG: type II toxin-antitoxin system RelE/ParE family toxin [Bacteroidota bacterium]
MRNTFKIVWSDESLSNLANIVEYLEKNWTDKEIFAFFYSVNRLIKIIKTKPLTFPHSNNLKIRRAVLSKKITLYYSVFEDSIVIVSLFDTRQNPKKKNY